MATRTKKSNRGRPPREAFSKSDLQGVADSLHSRIEKLATAMKGMDAVGVDKIEIDEALAMRNGLDAIRRFCDDALEVLRSLSKHGNRPWDKYDK